MREKILGILKNYNKDEISIATLGSHSALNILKGAKEEGFKTICIARKRERVIYESFGVADEIWEVSDFTQLLDESVQKRLREANAILIPHGSFNAYIGKFDKLLVPIFGNRVLMEWETKRENQEKWLRNAGLRMPKTFQSPKEIDRLVIVKYPGAKGGKGYFLATSYEDFKEKAKKFVNAGLISEEEIERAFIQEYVVGANVYFSFFYSPVYERIELISVDRRYESNADGLGRIPAEVQLKKELDLTFTVVGNFPVVLRESMLAEAIEAGIRVYEESKRIAYPGMVGPFCLESVIDEEGRMYFFEISARIVAGTNVGIPSSPYSYILFGENMYMGKRIAREIKLGIEKEMLDEMIY